MSYEPSFFQFIVLYFKSGEAGGFSFLETSHVNVSRGVTV